MANYSLVLDTKFKPFSYAEMLAPVAAATQAHQALEEEYGNLSAKADVWENMANEQSDPLAYKMYKGYSDDLRDRADTLLREGLNASSRKGMLDMRARYSKEIAPIEIAYKRREELAAEQRKAYAANPTLRYERYANAMSLDDFIKNPSIDYGRSYSGALLTQQVAQAAANYAKVLTREGKLKSLGLPFQYTKDLGHGATPEQVLAVINKAAQDGEEGAISFLRGIRDQVIASSGTNAWITPGSAAAKERDAFANMGLYSALGQTEIKDYTDTYSKDNALAIAKERRDAVRDAVNKMKMYDIDPTPLYGESEVTNKNAKIAKIMKERIYKYFNPSNNYALSKGGGSILRSPSKRVKDIETSGLVGETVYKTEEDPRKTELIRDLRRVGVSQKAIDRFINNGDPGTLNNEVRKIRNRINSGRMATGTPNIDIYRQTVKTKEQKDMVMDKMTAAAGVGELQMITGLEDGYYTKEKIGPHKYKQVHHSPHFTTKGVKREDFKKMVENAGGILYIANSPTTYNQLVELADGTKFIIPKGVLGEHAYSDLNDVSRSGEFVNGQSGLNQLINLGSVNPGQIATYLNTANNRLASILTSSEGATIKPNDGTIEFGL